MLQIIYKFFQHHFLNFQGKNPWQYSASQGIFFMKNTNDVLSFVDNWKHEYLDLNLLKNDAN